MVVILVTVSVLLLLKIKQDTVVAPNNNSVIEPNPTQPMGGPNPCTSLLWTPSS